jgi:hypothetical protein
MGKPISRTSLEDTGTNFSHHERQIFYLLTAFRVLPGSGSYTVNLVMLFLSVRRLAVERSSRRIDVTGASTRACTQRSSLSLRVRRLAKRGIILVQTPRVVLWISPRSAFQLATTRQTSACPRQRHRTEVNHSPRFQTEGNSQCGTLFFLFQS